VTHDHLLRVTRRLGLLALIAACVPAPASAQQPQAGAEPTVVSTGEGVVQAVPDRAWITIGAESRASNPREAQRRNAEAMRPVQDKLRGAGIPAEAIKTVAYDLHYEWDYVEGRRVGRGYVARNTIEVRVDDIDRVGEYLEIAVGSGATSLSGIRFDLKERDAIERQALRQAVADARARAMAAASGAGATLDRILRIEEQGVSSPSPVPLRTFEAKAAAADVPIAAGEMEVRAHVTVTTLLK
jgi:uncharacterized protein YggE